MKIVRKKLTADEFSPANKRYLLDEDMVQTSPDGGVTWYDDPASDPRHNPLNLFPPRTGGDPQCDAAENMMQHFKFLVDAFLAGGSILAVVNVWLGLLLFLPGVNILVALLLAIADALFTTGVVVIEAAMTETVYEQIKCILYCNIGTDGQMSAEQLESVYSDVDEQIGGVAALVFQQVTSAWGEVGFSNAGAEGEATGDCDECECCDPENEWEKTWTAAMLAPPSWDYVEGCTSVYTTDVGWSSGENCGGYYRTAMTIAFNLPSCSVVTYVEAKFSGSQTYARIVGVQNHDGSGFQGYQDYSNTPGTSPITAVVDFPFVGGLTNFIALLDDPSPDTCVLYEFTARGTGDEPDWG